MSKIVTPSVFLLLIHLLVSCALPSPAPPTATPFAGPVRTPQDLEAYIALAPQALRYRLDDEVAIHWHASLDNTAEPVGSVFIYHIPSMATVVLDRVGEVDT